MKIAIISDIHSNPTALQTCIEDAERKGCTRFVCLGDIVGYGYDPNACIEIVRSKKMLCIMGNHDAGLVGRLPLTWFSYVAKQGIDRQTPIVSDEDKKWLDNLPYKEVECSDNGFPVAYAHGTYEFPGRFDYINYVGEAFHEFPYLRRDRVRTLFVGHTHLANWFSQDQKDEWSIIEGFLNIEDASSIDLNGVDRIIVNAGSCGYPRNQPYSIYCIYDDEKHTATHQILPFDFADYRKKMTAAGIDIPLWLESREKQAEERPVQFK